MRRWAVGGAGVERARRDARHVSPMSPQAWQCHSADCRGPEDAPLLPGLTVVVPVFNSEQTVGELVSALAHILPTLCANYELILINDGSRDRSWQVIREIAAQHPWVCAVNMMRNFGQHNAILCGVRAARATRS